MKMLCPTGCFVDGTGNRKEIGVAAEVYSSQTAVSWTDSDGNRDNIPFFALTWVTKVNSLL